MDIMKRPAIVGLIALIIGIGLGVWYGWGLQPVEWTDAPVDLLRADLQEDHLRMTIDSFRVNGDQNMAIKRYQELGPNAPAILNKISQDPGQLDPGAILTFQQVLVENNASSPPVVEPAGGGNSLGAALIFGSVIALVILMGAGAFCST